MQRFSESQLKELVFKLFSTAGATEENARVVADSLVTASLKGHDSHGILGTLSYLDRMDATADSPDPTKREDQDSQLNRIDPTSTPETKHITEIASRVECTSCFGRVVGKYAAAELIDIVDERGIGIVSMRDVNHLGRIGQWAEIVAEEGYLFTSFVKAEGKLVAPAGSADRKLSTNPLTYGIPTFDALPYPIVLDIATSMVAGGKTREKQLAGESLPENWTINDDGDSVQDPTAFRDGEGALQPLGGQTAGYKGFGLSLMAELFGSIIGDGVIAGERYVIANNTAGFIGIDPTLFTTKAAIEDRITILDEHIKDAEYSDAISIGPGGMQRKGLLPGEAEYLTANARAKDGIPIPEQTVDQLSAIATELGVDSEQYLEPVS